MTSDEPLDPQRMLDLSVRQFAAATARKTPIPGGGSVAGVVGMLATALGEMSVAFSRGKKAFAGQEALHEELTGRLGRARGLFEALGADDAAAYLLYQEAAKAQGPDKAAQQALALAAAVNVPRQASALALTVLEDLGRLAGACSKHLLSDLAAGAVLAEATVRLCDYNVRVNAASMDDKAQAEELRRGSSRDLCRAEELRSAVEKVVAAVL